MWRKDRSGLILPRSANCLVATGMRMAASSGSVDWTPSAITTALWLDADDASTFTLTGSDIDQWNDKSGNSRNAIPATATKPTRTASGISSMGSVVFSSLTDPLITSSFDNPSGTDGLMVAMIIERTASPVNFSNIVTKGAVNEQWSLIWASPAYSNVSYFRNDTTTGNTASSPSSTVADSTAYIFTGYMADAGIAQFFDGTEITGSQGSATRNFGSASALTIGSSPDATYASTRFQGSIGEIVVVYADITTSTRQKLEGYLAHKWSLTANLPVGHPYKSFAPTT